MVLQWVIVEHFLQSITPTGQFKPLVHNGMWLLQVLKTLGCQLSVFTWRGIGRICVQEMNTWWWSVYLSTGLNWGIGWAFEAGFLMQQHLWAWGLWIWPCIGFHRIIVRFQGLCMAIPLCLPLDRFSGLKLGQSNGWYSLQDDTLYSSSETVGHPWLKGGRLNSHDSYKDDDQHIAVSPLCIWGQCQEIRNSVWDKLVWTSLSVPLHVPAVDFLWLYMSFHWGTTTNTWKKHDTNGLSGHYQ